MPITLDGTNGITTPTYGGADTSEYLVPVTQFKNRIINGAMQIDQRNAGASVTANAGVFGVDRFQMQATQSSKGTLQQNAGSVTPPAGFRNYLGFTSSSAYSVISSDIFAIWQKVEGFNIYDFAWGTANAKTVTLSFWTRSSLTGTFGGAIFNRTGARSYAFTYTISSANTWEYKTVTIAGDTSGTWDTNNDIGLYVTFGLGVGSSNSGTAGSWSGSLFYSATGATSVVGTNGATFYITGVQLEVGSTATSFDYRPYGTELALCQRYYEKSYNTDVAVGANTAVGIVGPTGVQGQTSNAEIGAAAFFRITKRATPTMSYWDAVGNSGKSSRVEQGVRQVNNCNIFDNNVGANQFSAYSTTNEIASAIIFHFAASSEL